MVPGTGIEPVRSLKRKILSLVCLPISPRRQQDEMGDYTELAHEINNSCGQITPA